MSRNKWFTLAVIGLSVVGTACSGESGLQEVDSEGMSGPQGAGDERESERGVSEGWDYIDPESGEVYPVNHNREVSAVVYLDGEAVGEPDDGGEFGTVGQALTATDSSGKIALEYVTCSPNNLNAKKTTCACAVSADYVLIGGGARVDYTGAGAMLYESRPQDINNAGSGSTWLAGAKAHMVDDAHTLTCQAVGMKVKDTSGNWLPKATLKPYIDYKRVTSLISDAPSTQCDSPAGKFVVGGGAKSNWTGAGQLLTESYPNSGSSWFAKSKAHMVSDQASLDVHCISVAASIPNFGSFLITVKSKQQSIDTGSKSVLEFADSSPKMVPTCAAGRSTYVDEGRLLTGLEVSDLSTMTTSKDHMVADNGWVSDRVIQVRKAP